MKNYLLKRHAVIHLLSLMAIVASAFIEDPLTKIPLLLVGIIGLFVVSLVKGKKIVTYIYGALLLVALVGGYLYLEGAGLL